nr:MAG TPA: hypothetical protein [Caudoviricetes sp.]DAT87491.1 MAG TPA: hypothetical protein [Caudoviricetes sp.]
MEFYSRLYRFLNGGKVIESISVSYETRLES